MNPLRKLSHPYAAVGMESVFRKAIKAEKEVFDMLGRKKIERMVDWRKKLYRKKTRSISKRQISPFIDRTLPLKGRPHKYNFAGMTRVGDYFEIESDSLKTGHLNSNIHFFIKRHQPDWLIREETRYDKLRVIRVK